MILKLHPACLSLFFSILKALIVNVRRDKIGTPYALLSIDVFLNTIFILF